MGGGTVQEGVPRSGGSVVGRHVIICEGVKVEGGEAAHEGDTGVLEKLKDNAHRRRRQDTSG